MKLNVPTKGNKLLLRLYVIGRSDCIAQIQGYDDNRKRSYYINQKVYINPGLNVLDFALPITPKELTITIGESPDPGHEVFFIEALEILNLPTHTDQLDQQIQDFAEFNKWFSLNAGNFRRGWYNYVKGDFWINYMPKIRDRQLGVLDTPARIERRTGEIQVAKRDYNDLTIPQRFVINQHEFFHNYLNTDDESECDLNAIDVALAEGFDPDEIYGAFSDILSDTAENSYRMGAIEQRLTPLLKPNRAF